MPPMQTKQPPHKMSARQFGAARGRIRHVFGSILQRIAIRENAAVDECIARHGGLVWAMARRASVDQPDAEDAVQEIFLDIWQNAARYDPAVASETAFIAMLARRRLIDRYRQRRRTVSTEPLDAEPSSEKNPKPDRAELCEEATRVRDAMERLPMTEKQVLRLSIEQGLSHSQIAERLQMALGTVKSHARRGLIRLRKSMQVAEASVEVGGEG